MYKKILFLDRDGTIIDEPEDKQVDCLTKLKLKKNVIPALLQLKQAGFSFVMVSNQDGLGTKAFPQNQFDLPQQMLMDILATQGILFDAVYICPHFSHDACQCRKPQLGLITSYLRDRDIDFSKSFVIGDRETDIQLANNMGIQSILFTEKTDWLQIARQLLTLPRRAEITRKTHETNIAVIVDFNQNNQIKIVTGLGFFDHMLEQLAKHGGFDLMVNMQGDLNIDEHHTVEDTGIAIGTALKKALGDKLGINRYGFLLPMDEASAQISIDLSGRAFTIFEGQFSREKVGDLPTELVPHFFRSLAESLGAAIHIKVKGENAHHMIESIFKGVGRVLRQAIYQQGNDLPTTKGVL